MDEAWRAIFERNAEQDLPLHRMSCWTEKGYEERLRAFPRILEKVSGVKTVLDVGCGPGVYAEKLHKSGYDVTGVDYAQAALERARKRVPEVRFVLADGYRLPYEEDSFDLVISIGALQCLKDHRTFTRELARVAKKAVILSTLRRRTKNDPDEELEKALKKDEWPARSYHPDDLKPLLEEKGFDVDVITSLDGREFSDFFFLIARKS
ncbi:MAG: class I SAM-dependent methyltransferase [Candidatus Woesearchaeota archaeon]